MQFKHGPNFMELYDSFMYFAGANKWNLFFFWFFFFLLGGVNRCAVQLQITLVQTNIHWVIQPGMLASARCSIAIELGEKNVFQSLLLAKRVIVSN